MKLLFFDMEFANGKVTGSIYSIGYLVTDESFRVLVPPTDLLISPECAWNSYVEEHILAYPKEDVEAAPNFPSRYEQLSRLFSDADVAVGFSLGNDTRALKSDCERYGLSPLDFRTFDLERLCKQMDEHREAHGLAGYVKAWYGETPDNQHRSDGDAYATMMLLRAVCGQKHVTPEMLMEAYPSCVSRSLTQDKKKARKVKHRYGKKRSRSGKSKPKEAVASSKDV